MKHLGQRIHLFGNEGLSNLLLEQGRLIRFLSAFEVIKTGRMMRALLQRDVLFYCCILLLLIAACRKTEQVSPAYPQSKLISGINLNWDSHRRLAHGSDNWPITWADDDHQYTAWGDGGGFGGSNKLGRVSLGVARIEGDRAEYTGINVLGGVTPEKSGSIAGKSYGILSVDSAIYMWVSPGSNTQGYEEARLYKSTDYGATWLVADWAFEKVEGLVFPTFLQAGRDYAERAGDYVYNYAINLKNDKKLAIQKPGEVVLMRTSRSSLMNKAEYEFFCGLDEDSKPIWKNDPSKRKPVFFDGENGVGWNLSVTFNPGLQRFILITENRESLRSNIGIYESPKPWGPWETVYFGKFGVGKVEQSCFYYNIANKWLTSDGKKFVLIFTGVRSNDSWNSVEGRFLLNH